MKTKNLFSIFSSVIIFFLLFSIEGKCQNFGIPHAGATLSSFNKSDLQLELGVMSMKQTYDDLFFPEINTTQNFHLSVGGSPLKHLDLKAFYSSVKREGDRTFSKLNHESYLYGFEVGGYYNLKYEFRQKEKNSFTETKSNPLFVNIAIGSNWGNEQLDLENSFGIDNSINLNFQKKYVHFGIHWKRERFGFSFFYRLGNMVYLKGISDGQSSDRSLNIQREILEDKSHHFTNFTFRGEYGLKWIKLYGQITQEQIPNLEVGPFSVINFGIVINARHFKNIFSTKSD